ncbi:lysophospholipid acyltransferase family protein [Granulicella arctica]|uniref:1-acyl-sn-glycerol-3-phosphate acyltransferase n=1 Tax=Granulicella arctica TaxID=940613 RepID=A0A7Y9PGT0_9BACT|nr:lysophospholipid acyltransferase family protein [Granulicella arctica]NYF79469.1 1-acyl-sn-glycerol-3-phosphate acyltransferase [Granulicella arctica]
MRIFRSIWRSLYLLLLLIAARLDGRFFSRPRMGAEGAIWIHGWSKRIVRAMGIEYSVGGNLPLSGAVVSNHLSYLDILLYSAIAPFVMVAKRQVRSWPLLGWLTAQAGTVYVERSEDVIGRKRQTHAEVNAQMAAAYASGLPVLFFPEGTTTDGMQVLPFRRGLFHSVLNDEVPLRVATLRFELGEGNGAATVGEDVCFVGDALFGPHIFRFLGLRGVTAKVRFGEEIVTRSDRFVLSQGAQARVAEMVMQLGQESGAVEALHDLLDGPVKRVGAFDGYRSVRG